MSVTEQLIGFVAMAAAIMAILTVGTLLAADIIHLGRRTPAPHTRESDDPTPAEEPVDAFVPLGSSLAAGSRLRSPR